MQSPWTDEDDQFDESLVGVERESKPRERGDMLTEDDVAWAIEQGATSEDEIFRMVKEHKEQTLWQQ